MEAGWGSGFEATKLKAELYKRSGKFFGRFFTHATFLDALHADQYTPSKESSGTNDHGIGTDISA